MLNKWSVGNLSVFEFCVLRLRFRKFIRSIERQLYAVAGMIYKQLNPNETHDKQLLSDILDRIT